MVTRVLIALLFPLYIAGQSYCVPYKKPKTVCGGEQIKLTASAGACYHYNAITYGMKYSGLFIDAVLMTRTERMPNMPGEEYAIIGYENYLEGGVGIMNNGAVIMAGGMYPFNNWLYASLRAYQTTNKMTHIVIGLRVEL